MLGNAADSIPSLKTTCILLCLFLEIMVQKCKFPLWWGYTEMYPSLICHASIT